MYKISYPDFLDNLSDIFKSHSHTLYIVGGFVRDGIIGYESDDIDICSDAKPEKVIDILAKSSDFSVAKSNLPLGTIIIRYKGVSLEYTAFRSESYRNDGTHTPNEVNLNATIQEDALRRDFTCNALYYDISQSEILDFFNGIKDIEEKTLKTTRKPHSVFTEDALRILRLARIAGETMFLPNDETLAAAKEMCRYLKNLSKERIVSEIKRIFDCDKRYPISSSDNIKHGLKVLFDCGATDILFTGVSEKSVKYIVNAQTYSVKAALFLWKAVDLVHSAELISPDSGVKKDILFLLAHQDYNDHEESLKLLTENGYRKGRLLEEYIRTLDKSHVNLSKLLKNMDRGDHIISMKTLDISGNDIKNILEIRNAPEIGKIKKALLSHIIEHPEDNNRESLLILLKNNHNIS